MAKKERKDKKEKPLDKMTTKELKDLALASGEVSGVHGMNKNELISAIKEIRGIVEEKQAKSTDVRAIKKQIAGLKEEKARLLEAGEKKRLEILRRRMSRLKKKTRRAA